ncbi:MAG TPA: hypothetical protein VFI47_25805 [Acidimicrobiales bacterium]|nr:hypothetical protein [Acidimicrobiales bacterium]
MGGDDAHLNLGVQGPEGATALTPRAPAPHTSARPPDGGGWRVTLWSETAHGSARMARSSSRASGTGNSMVEWAGISSAKPPVASRATPVWRPVLIGPVVKLQHRLRSPASQAGQTGDTPRGAHDSQGLRTTRWPTSKPLASGPNSTTSATTSWPGTWGNEHRPLSALSLSPSKSPRTCLASEPQIPVSRGRTTSQSGRRGRASGTSRRAHGVVARLRSRRLSAVPGGGSQWSGRVP